MQTTTPNAVFNNDRTLNDVLVLRKAAEIKRNRDRRNKAAMLDSLIRKGVYIVPDNIELIAKLVKKKVKAKSKKK